MDHFAKPDDELAVALRQGRLRRNFQGYTAMPDAYEVVGLGMTAIGDIGEAYLHNVKDLKEYYAAIDGGRLAVHRGWELSAEDVVRRAIIGELMCNFRVDFDALGARYGRHLADFPDALADLRGLQDEGLVVLAADALEVTALGRLFVRNVAMVFDEHLRTVGTDRPTYSRTV
jgi:oxygen-independent coproporphyrinogen-3 oxidase